jgi:hypothetical protein
MPVVAMTDGIEDSHEWLLIEGDISTTKSVLEVLFVIP